MFSLRHKTAFVTGAASGIGAAIAAVFAAAGAKVIVADCDEVAGRARVRRLSKRGRSVRFVCLDVTSEESVRAAARSVGDSVDILVNNAGVGSVGTILQTQPLELERLIAVNVNGTYLATKAFLPGMISRRGGSVINVASVAGVVGLRDRFAYTTTKFAVVGMTKALALDHSHLGVRFNAICPGRVLTPFVEKRLAEYPDPVAARRQMEGTQLAGRMAEPEEVAAAALYLAADESKMVTGSSLMIDSGWSAGK